MGKLQEESFMLIKEKLCNACILAFPKDIKDFVVYSNASNKGLGCVLIKIGKVTAYTSRQLKYVET